MRTDIVLLLIVALLVGLALLFLKRGRVIGTLLVGAAIAITATLVLELRELRSSFDQLQIGVTVTRVEEVMGRPGRVTDGTESIYGGRREFSQIPKDCETEYWYKSTLSPEQWAFCFDSAGLLVGKQHYASY